MAKKYCHNVFCKKNSREEKMKTRVDKRMVKLEFFLSKLHFLDIY